MSQYWINVLNSAHNVSNLLAIALGILTLAMLSYYTITYHDKNFRISFKYPLISIILFILTLLLYIFTSPIN